MDVGMIIGGIIVLALVYGLVMNPNKSKGSKDGNSSNSVGGSTTNNSSNSKNPFGKK